MTREEAFGARPLRNPVIAWEVLDNGRVLLTVPLEQKPWLRLLQVVTRVPAEKKVELDEVGSDVWQWCDGEARVTDLIDRLAASHKLHRREAEVSLTQFLETLAKRRFVGLAVELDESRAEELGDLVVAPRQGSEQATEARDG